MISPGYLALANRSMNSSMRTVVHYWGLSDKFILSVYLTEGRRALIRARAFISWADRLNANKGERDD
jgi:hypothetical protein